MSDAQQNVFGIAEDEYLQIIELKSTNVKRLKAVAIHPSGEAVVLSGKNEQGKSSVLDSIQYALGGVPSEKDAPEPIHHGAERAEVELTLGVFTEQPEQLQPVDDASVEEGAAEARYIVKRTWTDPEDRSKSYLYVTTADGWKPPGGEQSFLDDIRGQIAFDPLEFAQMDAAKQVKTLKDMIETDVDFDALEAQEQTLRDERKDVGKERDRLKGVLDSMEEVEAVEPVKVQELIDQREELREFNQQQDELALALDPSTLMRHLNNATVPVDGEQVDYADAPLRVQKDYLLTWIKKIPEPQPKQDLSEINEQINQAEEINAQARQYQQYRETQAEYEARVEAYQQYTDRIQEIQAARTEAIANASMPIKGLGFNEQYVTYLDKETGEPTPFRQLGQSGRLKVSIAMSMAMNPKLRVILARDASLLDEDNLSLIKRLAGQRHFQIWLETVGTGDANAVIIEDGQVKQN